MNRIYDAGYLTDPEQKSPFTLAEYSVTAQRVLQVFAEGKEPSKTSAHQNIASVSWVAFYCGWTDREIGKLLAKLEAQQRQPDNR